MDLILTKGIGGLNDSGEEVNRVKAWTPEMFRDLTKFAFMVLIHVLLEI